MTNAWEMDKALLVRERDLAKLVAQEAMRMLTDEQLKVLRAKLDGAVDEVGEVVHG